MAGLLTDSGDGYGYGGGYGFGFGDGFGFGYGYDDGRGYGYDGGYGDGYGGGYGYGYGDGGGQILTGMDDAEVIPVWGIVRVGCQAHPLEHWREHWRDIADEHSWEISDEDVAEAFAEVDRMIAAHAAQQAGEME